LPPGRFSASVAGAMEADRKTTVVFADLIDATKLYGAGGDVAAHEALARCLEHLQGAVAPCGGRLVRESGDKVMVLIGTPDAAADAAVAMHTAVKQFPPAGKARPGLGVGFHYGNVINEANGVFGDTVNLASRLVELAANGQIITTEDTAKQLSSLYRACLRRLGPISIRGRSDEVAICELAWRTDEPETC